MSDWEDEYDGDGAAIQKPTTKPAPTEYKPSYDNVKKESVSFGERNGTRFGGPREWRSQRGDGASERSSWEDGGRPFRGGPPGKRSVHDEKSDSDPPVTMNVENSSVGRIIGLFLH